MGDSANYTCVWKEVSKNQTLSMVDSLSLIADTSILITVSLSDGCIQNTISDTFQLKVNLPLSSTISTSRGGTAKSDTILCYGESVKLYSRGAGGRDTSYKFEWLMDGNIISNSDSIIILSEAMFDENGDTQTLLLVFKDNCTFKNDTSKFVLKVLPGITSSVISVDTVCFGEDAMFIGQSNGGNGNYGHDWYDENFIHQGSGDTLIVANDNLNKGTVTRFLVSSDNCNSIPDTITSTTEFLGELMLDIFSSDTCTNSSVLLTTSLFGGKVQDHEIQWFEESKFLGTSKKDMQVTPPGRTTTYKAILSDKCSAPSDTARITIGYTPKIELLASPLEGCQTLNVKYNLETNTTDSYIWNLSYGNGNTFWDIQKDSTEFSYINSGTYIPSAELNHIIWLRK